jgi:hypothetical protein
MTDTQQDMKQWLAGAALCRRMSRQPVSGTIQRQPWKRIHPSLPGVEAGLRSGLLNPPA